MYENTCYVRKRDKSRFPFTQVPTPKQQSPRTMPTEKVALVGSGNWGSAIATKIGINVLANDMFDKGSAPPRP